MIAVIVCKSIASRLQALEGIGWLILRIFGELCGRGMDRRLLCYSPTIMAASGVSTEITVPRSDRCRESHWCASGLRWHPNRIAWVIRGSSIVTILLFCTVHVLCVDRKERYSCLWQTLRVSSATVARRLSPASSGDSEVR